MNHIYLSYTQQFYQSVPTKKSVFHHIAELHRGSYMSAHVLLNLFNELGKSDKCEAFLLFRSKFNKFNYTGARMLDSIYHITLT